MKNYPVMVDGLERTNKLRRIYEVYFFNPSANPQYIRFSNAKSFREALFAPVHSWIGSFDSRVVISFSRPKAPPDLAFFSQDRKLKIIQVGPPVFNELTKSQKENISRLTPIEGSRISTFGQLWQAYFLKDPDCPKIVCRRI